LEKKLKEWRFRKNLKEQDWRSVRHKINKRNRSGQKSEVLLYANRVEAKAIENGFRHLHDSIEFLVSARSPEPSADLQVTVCTPPPLPLEFEYPTRPTMPWLIFHSMYSDGK
jgi:hypothetical protein